MTSIIPYLRCPLYRLVLVEPQFGLIVLSMYFDSIPCIHGNHSMWPDHAHSCPTVIPGGWERLIWLICLILLIDLMVGWLLWFNFDWLRIYWLIYWLFDWLVDLLIETKLFHTVWQNQFSHTVISHVFKFKANLFSCYFYNFIYHHKANFHNFSDRLLVPFKVFYKTHQSPLTVLTMDIHIRKTVVVFLCRMLLCLLKILLVSNLKTTWVSYYCI